MSTLARRNLVFAWLAILSAALGFMAWGEAAQERKVTDLDEINVQRLNVVEADGKPRVIISNRARMAGIYWNGKQYAHPNRDNGGFLFYNDDGTEAGGMMFMNRTQGEHHAALSNLLFDHYNQQEAVGLVYVEEDARRYAGLRVWNQPTESMLPFLELGAKLQHAKTDAERAQLQAQLQKIAEAQKAAGAFTERLFAGKETEGSVLRLADKKGNVRLALYVDNAGAPSIQFIDEAGKVVRRITP